MDLRKHLTAYLSNSLGAAALVLSLAAGADALVVKTWNGPGTPELINDSAPADDPGWANLVDNRGALYLGDHWVITANHAGHGTIDIAGSTFPIISSTQSRLLGNPSTFAGRSIDASSDIRIYRVGVDENGMSPEDLDPAIRQIEIATSLPSTSTDLTMIGEGLQRDINAANTDNGQYYFSSTGGLVADLPSSTYRGFLTNGTAGDWVWGTNRRASASSISGVVRSGSNILIEVSGLGDTIGFPVKFDEFGLDDEAQAQAGDSGGPVFWKEDGEWVLGGVMHAVFPANNRVALLGAFTSHTVISDFSYDDYYDEIAALRAESRYANMGDIDLDGSITGEIVNGVATGDLGILIDNWFHQSSEANIQSWIKGDLNQDSVVDIQDFVLMRDALGGSIDSQSFATLLASVAVPEPTAAALASGACLLLGVSRRRR